MSWRTDKCPQTPNTPYLLRTRDGPIIAEWRFNDWWQWFCGEFQGAGIGSSNVVTGWQEIDPW